jgi:metallo-beta-lactamase class B
MPHIDQPPFLALAVGLVSLGGCGTQSADTVAQATGAFPATAFAEACEDWDDWEKPAPPFRIYGDTYHVGTCGISAVLVAGSDGLLLIDSGTRGGSELVAANVEALGFSLGDVRYLTHTQEHGDHIGGMAYLKALTGARMVASPRAQSVFETGILNTDDPQYEPHEPMETLTVDQLIADGEGIDLGGKTVVAHFTPGHSPGAITWRWEECEDTECVALLFTDGLAPFAADGYRWTDYPEYLAVYRESLEWLEAAEVDICLAAHPSQVGLIERIEGGSLVDEGRCRGNARFTQGRVDIIVADEQGS